MTRGRLTRLAPLAAPAALLAAAAVRHAGYLAGGSVVGRDAVFFFVPLREVTSRLLAAGEWPLWNEASGAGRALAANPNAAVFWPLTWLVPLVGTTGLLLLHVALALLLAYAALRWLGVSRGAAAAGGLVLLFSGVFQTAPLLYTTVASLAPLPVALVALGALEPSDARGARRRAALAGLALGFSLLGGEPVVTAIGAAGAAFLSLGGAVSDLRAGRGAHARRRLAALGLAALLSAGVAAAQLLPTAGELSRSARGSSMRAEEGALFWSVRPGRLLTLLEPRLAGDPLAEDDRDYWGASAFDAGNPYFHELAVGLLPLALAAAAWGDRRGRAALSLAVFAALLSFGRFVPPVGALLAALPVLRYPEKWWLLATLGLAAAAAVGAECACRDDAARRRLSAAGLVLGALLAVPALLALVAPSALGALLRAAGLAGEGLAPERAAALLLPLLLVGAGSALLAGLLPRLVLAGRLAPRAAAFLLAALFLLDAARRVSGSSPPGPHGFWAKAPAEAEAARVAAGAGRFYADGADDAPRATALARERAGLDPLRPITAAAWGLRFGGDNDVDRMSPAGAVAAQAALARMPWGGEKVRRLRALGVAAARTDAPSDPAGVREVARFGSARLVAIEGSRPEHLLVARAVFAPRGAGAVPASSPLEETVLEGEGAPVAFGAGSVEVVERTNHFRRLRVDVAPPGGLLLVARTFDPCWKVRVDGAPAASFRADGFLTAVPVPAGAHEVVLSYENGLLRAGAAVTLLALAAAAALLRGGRA